MATVGVAIVPSWGGCDLEGAIASASDADEIVVLRPPGGPVVGRERAGERGKVTFFELDWGGFPALSQAARTHSRCDWLLTIEESERLDEELRSSLRWLRLAPVKEGYFLVSRKLDLFGRSVTARGCRRVQSAGVNGNQYLGRLPGSVACSAACSLSRMIDAINARSDLLAGALYREGRPPGLLAMTRTPLAAFVGAFLEVGLGAGTGGFIYAVARGYSEVATVGKLWERARASRAKTLLVAGAGQERELPEAPAYVRLASRRGSVTALRALRDPVVRCLEAADPEDCFGEPIPGGGRGAAWVVPLGQQTGVLRWYRRGGLARYVMRDRYLGLGARWRPLREMAACVEARRRGVAVPEVLGVRIDRLFGPFYRAAILTRRMEGFLTAWEALRQSQDCGERQAILREVLVATERMHDAGIYHRDLNLNNILVGKRDRGWEVCFVDFDRAALQASPVGKWRRKRARRRMARSLVKLASACASLPRLEIASLAGWLERGRQP